GPLTRPLPGARRGVAVDPARGDDGGAAAGRRWPTDRRGRPPPDAADHPARLGARAAPDLPGVSRLRLALHQPATAGPEADSVRGELPAPRRYGRLPAARS